MILGITGSIATGKSTVSRIFARLGASLVSADQLAREVVRPGSPTLQQLVDLFGSEILQPDGTLNRPVLAQMVFSDAQARAAVNRLTHPAIAELAEQTLREKVQESGVWLVVYEAPLLFEAGAEQRVDAVLVVTATEEVQIRRLMARDGLDEAAARARIAAQMPQREKVARADYVIDNSGPVHDTEEKVRELFALLRRRHALPNTEEIPE